MVQFNTKEKELIIKLVYYGPGLSGKTTNLKHIHKTTDPDKNTQLISLNTEKDRTLFFDLLPYEIGHLSGMKIKLQLYTVPGQAQYSTTRKAVLSGADGIAFIADSQRYMMTSNINSLKDMIFNLKENNINHDKIPLVLQYNKRDLPKISGINELNNILNRRNSPYFEGIALNGDGVFETLTKLLNDTIDYIVKEYEISVLTEDISKIKKLIKKNLGRWTKDFIPEEEISHEEEASNNDTVKQEMKESPTEPKFSFETKDPLEEIMLLEKQYGKGSTYTEQEPIDNYVPEESEEVEEAEERLISDKELIEKAVDSNVKISQLYVQLDDIKRQLREKINELSVLNQVSNLMASGENVPEILKQIFKYAMEAKKLQHGSLLVPKKDSYKQLICIGFDKDPISSINLRDGTSLLKKLAEKKKIIAVNVLNSASIVDLGLDEDDFLNELEDLEIDSFIIAPMISKGVIHGIFNYYRVNSPFEFNKEDTEFLYSLATQGALVIENTKLKHKSSVSNITKGNKKTENLERLMHIVQKRLQGNINSLNSINEYFSASSQTHLELIVKNEKEMNKKVLKTINDIIER